MTRYVKLTILCFIILISCQKDILLKEGFNELNVFDWKVNEEENKIDIKFWLVESPIDSISNVVVKVRIDGIDLENSFNNPTVILDTEENSLHKGQKCIEHSWIPAITTTTKNVEEIKLYVK